MSKPKTLCVVIGLAGLLCCLAISQEPAKDGKTASDPLKQEIDKIRAELSSRDPNVRAAAIEKFHRLASELSDLGGRLATMAGHDPDEAVRANAARAPGHLGALGELAMHSLLYPLRDENPKVRANCAMALGRLAPNAMHPNTSQNVLKHLMDRLKDKSEEKAVRASLLLAVSWFGKGAQQAMPYFVEALDDYEIAPPLDSSWIKQSLAEAAVRILSESALRPTKETVPALLKCLNKEGDLRRQGSAAIALGRVGTAHPDVLPILLELLSGKDKSGLRASAVIGFGEMGASANEAVPELLRQLKASQDKNELALRLTIIAALPKISAEKDIVLALEKVVADRSAIAEERWRAARSLATLGPKAKEVVGALIGLLEDNEVRDAAAAALAAIGCDAVAPLLEYAWADKDRFARRAAIRALGQMGGDGKDALPKLKRLAESVDDLIQSEAIIAIQRIQKRR